MINDNIWQFFVLFYSSMTISGHIFLLESQNGADWCTQKYKKMTLSHFFSLSQLQWLYNNNNIVIFNLTSKNLDPAITTPQQLLTFKAKIRQIIQGVRSDFIIFFQVNYVIAQKAKCITKLPFRFDLILFHKKLQLIRMLNFTCRHHFKPIGPKMTIVSKKKCKLLGQCVQSVCRFA